MTIGVIFGLLAGLLWAADGALIGHTAVSNGVFAVLLTACVHDGLAAVWLGILNIRNKKTEQYMDCLRSGRFMRAFLPALLGGAVGMGANVAAIQLGGAAITGAITSAYPVAGAFIGMVFLNEKPNSFTVLGVLLVSLGAFVTAGFTGIGNADHTAGAVFALIAMVCWALEGILSKGGMKEISPDVLIGMRELISFVIYILILIPMICSGYAKIESGIFARLFLLLPASVAGAFSFLCWYRSMDRCGVSTAMSLNATYALWAVILSGLIGGTGLSIRALTGAAVILLGTVCTLYSETVRKEKDNEQEENIGSRH